MRDGERLIALEKAILSARNGDRGAARLALYRAEADTPDDPRCHVWLAWISDSPSEALEHLERALELNPRDAMALAGLDWIQSLIDFDLAQSDPPLACPTRDLPDEATVKHPTDGAAVSSGANDGVHSSTEPVDHESQEPCSDSTHSPAAIEVQAAATEVGPSVDPGTEPHDRTAADAEASVPEPAENDDGRPIALVADPSRTVRRLLARCLDQCGFRTLSASSGVEALEQLSRWTPELVICDVALPRLNGFELCRMIGSCPSSRPIPVMLLSRSDAPAEWQRAERAGAVDLVTIPFSPAALAAKIGEHCRNASVGSSGSPVA